jgi:Hint domain
MTTPNLTADIPLYIFPDSVGGYKIGINVSLNGGQTYQMYEFDTGGQGFWSAYNAAWFSNPVKADDMVATNSYSSGITYVAQVVTEPITLQGTVSGPTGPTATLLTVNGGNVAAIQNAEKPTPPDPFTDQQFQNDISNTPTPIPPIYNTFFGDFGMALGSSSQCLLGILPQLVGYSNGFIVNLGTYPTSNTPINPQGYVQVGTLQVGLTDLDIASFSTLITMQGSNDTTLFPVTNEPTYTERLGTGNVDISNGSVSYSGATSFVFDTGAPSTEVHPNTTEATDIASIIDNNGNLVPGTTFTVSSPGATQPVPPGTLAANWQMSFPAGNQSGLNQVGIAQADSGTGYVNTGLQPFFQGPVMYDVQDGVMGFNPISCFAAGTRIATPAGELLVETLCIGDLVCTASGPTRMITWIGHRRVDCDRHADPASILPMRIATGAFAPGQPARDLLLSPDHAVFFDGALIPIKYLLNGDTVHQVPAREVTYFHIELEKHDIVLADGLPVESYLDTGSRSAFANGGGAIQLHPGFASSDSQTSLLWEADGHAPLVVSGPHVERARRVLRRQSPSSSPRVRTT